MGSHHDGEVVRHDIHQVGSYVVFRDQTASSFTLTVGGGLSASDGFRRNRFAGFQVVAVELTP